MTDRMQRSFPIAAIVAALAIVACSKETSAPSPTSSGPKLDRATAVALFTRENVEPGPAPAPELAVLGRDLYHEQRLSTQNNLSCASCHDLKRFGQDNLPTSPGSDGRLGDRNSPSSVNAFRQIAQFWDGRAKDVEEQATGPILNPIEHGFTEPAEFVAKLRSIDGMEERFRDAFPGEEDPVTVANFGKAVGAFERTLVTHSRFDDWLDGNDSALTAEEKKGLATFLDVNCTMCHNGRTLGGGMFNKLGLSIPYETADEGRAKVTGNPAEKYFFKVPMLLNVAETAPYFHDGSVATLEEAVRLMGKHQLAKDLTDPQVASIVTFLKALTGEMQQPSSRE